MSRREHFDAGHGREEYSGFREGPRLNPLMPDGSDPEYLYRSVHPKEWEAAQAQGFLQSQGEDRGAGRVFASMRPEDYAGPGRITLQIKYDPEDRWETRWAGRENTAVTKQVPLDRVSVYQDRSDEPWEY